MGCGATAPCIPYQVSIWRCPLPISYSQGRSKTRGWSEQANNLTTFTAMLFKRFLSRRGLANIFDGACRNCSIFGEIVLCVEDLSLLAPYFPSLRWRLSAPYRMASGAAVRLVRHLLLPRWMCEWLGSNSRTALTGETEVLSGKNSSQCHFPSILNLRSRWR